MLFISAIRLLNFTGFISLKFSVKNKKPKCQSLQYESSGEYLGISLKHDSNQRRLYRLCHTLLKRLFHLLR